jgi:hypothetical protein
MGKQTTERYYPGNLPDNASALIPFLFDELWRIAQAITAHIVGMNAQQLGLVVPVTTVPSDAQLFIGAVILSDLPGGAFDPATGEYEVPENGQYQISVSSVVDPFGTGNKIYNVVLRIDIDGVPLWRSVDSGQDDQELGAAISLGARLLAGQVLTFWLQSQHDQFTGDIIVSSYLSINQTSSE